jgi:DtxR family Mn-dependent transcriptional regulator
VASSTVENYLKQLYLEERASAGEMVPMGRLAVAMGVVPGTATSMVKALADSGLVQYEPRGGVRLTASGRQLALHVLRRHRLVELFLVKVLGLDWSVVHDEADALEHAVSDRVLERIDVLLGHPTADPHGDPIPTPGGDVHEPHRMSLADCAVGVPQRIARVLDQEPGFLQFVERQGLMPGAVVTVAKREPAAEAVRIAVRSGEEVSLGLTAAAKILVESPQEAAVA